MSKWIPVLAVDDDECIHKALKRSLKLYGFKVYLAKDGFKKALFSMTYVLRSILIVSSKSTGYAVMSQRYRAK